MAAWQKTTSVLSRKSLRARVSGHNAQTGGLCARVTPEGITPHLVWDLLSYCENLAGVSCKLRVSVSALRSILEEHCETGADLKSLYAEELVRRRFHNPQPCLPCYRQHVARQGARIRSCRNPARTGLAEKLGRRNVSTTLRHPQAAFSEPRSVKDGA